MSTGHAPGDKWPHELLCRAAAQLEAQHPKNLCWIDFYGQQVIARVAWCGVVVVTSRASGRLLCKSLPGQPTELDTEV